MTRSTTRPRPGQQPSYVVALVGADLRTTLTPALHEREAEMLGLRYVYRTVDIAELGLSAGLVEQVLPAAHWLGLAGLNVTHPCKQRVLPLLDEVSPDAAAIGAVNTVVIENGRAVGHNTDWTGFAKSLQYGLPDAGLGKVLLVGAGGAGSAVCYALLSLGAEQVIVTDIRGGSADALADSLGKRFGRERIRTVAHEHVAEVLSAADGVVNATPVGMSGSPDSPLPVDSLRHDLWVADIVYRPMATPLLLAARGRGCRTLSGGGMAVYQAAHALQLFTGVVPDEQRMLAHFEELLALRDSEG
jgi:shikimate dehydrogenase